MKIAIYIYGNTESWRYTKYNHLTKFQGYDVFGCFIGGINDDIYPQNFFRDYTIIDTPQPTEVIAINPANSYIYDTNRCINACDVLRQKHENVYNINYQACICLYTNDIIDDIPQIEVSENILYIHKHGDSVYKLNVKSTDHIHTILSAQHTSMGNIHDMDIQSRNIIFDNVVDNVVDISSHLVKPKLDKIFQDNINKKIFLIPSVITIKSTHGNRNVFTAQDRLEQTMRQMKSIRDKAPDSVIILLEMSSIDLYQIDILHDHADLIVCFSQDEMSNNYCNIDPNKNKAELYVMKRIMEHIKLYTYSHVAKFGGRYWLSKNFSQQDFFHKEYPTFKVVDASINSYGESIIEPVLYCFPKQHEDIFINLLQDTMDILNEQFLDVERVFCRLLSGNNIYSPEYMEICGYSAYSGVYRYI